MGLHPCQTGKAISQHSQQCLYFNTRRWRFQPGRFWSEAVGGCSTILGDGVSGCCLLESEDSLPCSALCGARLKNTRQLLQNKQHTPLKVRLVTVEQVSFHWHVSIGQLHSQAVESTKPYTTLSTELHSLEHRCRHQLGTVETIKRSLGSMTSGLSVSAHQLPCHILGASQLSTQSSLRGAYERGCYCTRTFMYRYHRRQHCLHCC